LNQNPLNRQPIKSTLQHLFVPEKDPVWSSVILGFITLIALVLRFLLINKPIQYDEAYTFIFYASRSLNNILANYSAPNNHILHTILVAVAYHLFGASPWIVRLPALVAGTLSVPAAYIAARRFFSSHQALTAAALIAVTPGLIAYSANGRGYTMVTLFALLLANFAGILVTSQSKSALAAYTITGALGFYTIPIFLYPMAGISLWLAASYLTESGSRQNRFRKLTVFLVTCALSGLLTLILYSPVIFFGTGLRSLVGNEIVETQNWFTFVGNLLPRITNTGINWMMGIAPAFRSLLLGGFLIALFFYRKVSNQRLPMQVFLVLAIAILMLLQRVVPLPRVWLFLEAFYMIFAAAGLVWLADMLLQKGVNSRLRDGILAAAILLFVAGYLVSSIQGLRATNAQENDLPEEFAAAYIQDHIQPADTLIALPPIDIQTAYYLTIHGIPFERFYQPDHPLEIQNALVVLRTNSKNNIPQKVLDVYGLTPGFNLSAAELVFEYGPIQIYSIPAR
jgi:4-amino-4-deoxy-L-arabinose transferase-like glycosyltransferase